MAELWWAEAVIAVDRDPNWKEARATIDKLRPDAIPHWEDYVNELDGQLLAGVDPAAAEAPCACAGGESDAPLLPHGCNAVGRDVDEVAQALRTGRPVRVRVRGRGLRVYVYAAAMAPGPTAFARSAMKATLAACISPDGGQARC